MASLTLDFPEFKSHVAFEHLCDVFTDAKLVDLLQVGQTLQKEDSFDQNVSLLHVPNRLLVFLFIELFQAPVPENPGVQEILVDGGEFTGQYLVQKLNHSTVSLHNCPPYQNFQFTPQSR